MREREVVGRFKPQLLDLSDDRVAPRRFENLIRRTDEATLLDHLALVGVSGAVAVVVGVALAVAVTRERGAEFRGLAETLPIIVGLNASNIAYVLQGALLTGAEPRSDI